MPLASDTLRSGAAIILLIVQSSNDLHIAEYSQNPAEHYFREFPKCSRWIHTQDVWHLRHSNQDLSGLAHDA